MPSPTVFLDERYMLRPEYETRNYDLATDSRTMDFPASGIKIAGTAIDVTAAELNFLDIATLGTGAASKAVVLDTGDDYTWPSAGVLTCSHIVGNATPMDITGVVGSSSVGGTINIVGGAGNGAGNNGGPIVLTTGAGVNGTSGTADNAGALTITTGAAGTATTGTGGTGGTVSVTGAAGGAATGAAGTGGAGSSVNITAGAGGAATEGSSTETGGAGGAIALLAGVGGAAAAATGGAAGAITVTAGAGGAETTGTASAAGGAVTLTTGAGGLGTTGTGAASGILTLTTGTGGATTGDSDSNSSGTAANLVLNTGAGGAHTTGTAVAGDGGNIVVQPGDGGAGDSGDGTSGNGGHTIIKSGLGNTAANTNGVDGVIFMRPGVVATPTVPIMTNIRLPVQAGGAGTDTLTLAEMFGGIYYQDPTAAATVTTPTGEAMANHVIISGEGTNGALVVGDSFDFTMINQGNGTGEILTLAGGTSVTIIGLPGVDPGVAAEGPGVGTFRFRYNSADTWVGFRIA